MVKKQNELKSKFTKLIKSNNFSFDDLSQISTEQGVYIIYSNRNKVLHVGRTVRARNGLKQRLTDHKRGQSSFVKKGLKGDRDRLRNCHFKYIVEDNNRIRALLECYTIGGLYPEHIGLGKRKK